MTNDDKSDLVSAIINYVYGNVCKRFFFFKVNIALFSTDQLKNSPAKLYSFATLRRIQAYLNRSWCYADVGWNNIPVLNSWNLGYLVQYVAPCDRIYRLLVLECDSLAHSTVVHLLFTYLHTTAASKGSLVLLFKPSSIYRGFQHHEAAVEEIFLVQPCCLACVNGVTNNLKGEIIRAFFCLV